MIVIENDKMKTEKYKSLGLTIALQVPTSVEEFDKSAGKTGACLESANGNAVYRGSLAVFRDAFLHGISEADLNAEGAAKTYAAGTKPIKGIEAITGIDRKTVVLKDKDGKPRTDKSGAPLEAYDSEDSEAKYFGRVCDELVKQGKFADRETAAASFQPVADAVAAAILFDASETTRVLGPKKLAAVWKATAKAFLLGEANPARGGKPYELANLQKELKKSLGREFVLLNGDDGKPLPAGDDKNIEALGWMCKEYKDKQDVFGKM